ncbi:MAG: tetratricopeptide repeat protein [Treponema sp.]|jgi:tetratricopeptide (TPR) repeat protein|nr:tetratricopeptide repeat protein [Treponema sp.]
MSDIQEKTSLGDNINDFIQKNRKGIFIFLGAAVLLLAVFIGTLGIRNVIRNKAIVRVEELSRRYEELRFDIAEESRAEDVAALLAELEDFGAGGYAGARARVITAKIHSDKKNWAEAQSAWTGAAKAGAGMYLEPMSFFNAARAAEELGNKEDAVSLYSQCLARSGSFPQAAWAQFSIGRIEESRNNREAALEAYRTVVSKWPSDELWVDFAQNRIAVLQPAVAQ